MHDAPTRQQLVQQIHDLLLLERGEDIDVALMLSSTDYARAVLSLCRSSGQAELRALGEEFARQGLRSALPRPPTRPDTARLSPP